MKKIVLTYFIIFITKVGFSQNFNGQWKGSFIDNSAMISWGSNRCEYVLELESNGAEITGYSYTYFSEDGKKYYTICKVEGTFDNKKKYMEVKETERTKTNIPIEVVNSFQLHKLRWRREAGKEILEGNWIPAPGQKNKNTGFGTTILSKRVLTEIAPLAKKSFNSNNPLTAPRKSIGATKTLKQTIIASASPKKNPQVKPTVKTVIKPIVKTPNNNLSKKPAIAQKKDSQLNQTPVVAAIKAPIEKTFPLGFEKRNTSVLQTVVVENEMVKIELYDNGDIDGDSVTLFYNGKILLSHKKLTTQPIKIDLPVNYDEVNELVMYADNLGTIPPNTALMIVMDGNKRYEVRVTSDLKKSGTIRFVHNKKE
jgi:hypothetical protein